MKPSYAAYRVLSVLQAAPNGAISLTGIQKSTGASRSTVARVLKQLESGGYLEIQHSPRGNVYTVKRGVA